MDQFDTLERSNRYKDGLNLIQSNIEDTKNTTENTSDNLLNDKRNIDNQMIGIWNEVGGCDEKINPSGHISKKLITAFNKLLDKDLQKWEEYCKRIVNTKYLNGNTGFKATLLWSREPRNYTKVIEGYYPNEEQGETKLSKELSEEYLKKEISSLDAPEFWKLVKEKLLHQIGKETYISWIKNLNFIRFENGVLELKAKSKFISEYIEQQFGQKIKRASEKLDNKIKKIKIGY